MFGSRRSSNGPAKSGRRRASQRGGAIVEAAFLVPWLFFLFVGVLDLGFFYYDLMTVQNAARVAVIQTSASGCSTSDACFKIACPLVLTEMASLPGVSGLTTCTNGNTVTSTAPVAVSAPAPTTSGACGSSTHSYSVTASFLTLPMVPVPGILTGQLALGIPVSICGTS